MNKSFTVQTNYLNYYEKKIEGLEKNFKGFWSNSGEVLIDMSLINKKLRRYKKKLNDFEDMFNNEDGYAESGMEAYFTSAGRQDLIDRYDALWDKCGEVDRLLLYKFFESRFGLK